MSRFFFSVLETLLHHPTNYHHAVCFCTLLYSSSVVFISYFFSLFGLETTWPRCWYYIYTLLYIMLHNQKKLLTHYFPVQVKIILPSYFFLPAFFLFSDLENNMASLALHLCILLETIFHHKNIDYFIIFLYKFK